MIHVIVKKNHNEKNHNKKNHNENIGFHMEGHAEFGEEGNDIICAAVSVLAINCMNSIEVFTEANFIMKKNEKKGMIDFTLVDDVIPEDANLLLLSFFYGIQEIQKEYGTKYVKITNS